jgi:RNA polymerase sigma-70 factor (ECF subfamily)
VTEPQLVARAVAGDMAAQRLIYDQHVDRVYRLAYRLAGDEDLARDFTQETFMRAFDRMASFRGDSALGTWLHAIGVSVALNGLRKVKRIRQRETGLDDALTVGVATRHAEPDLKERLRAAIDGLPDGYRTVFVMHDVEGLHARRDREIARHPAGHSKAQLFRARARLRETLKDFAGSGWHE